MIKPTNPIGKWTDGGKLGRSVYRLLGASATERSGVRGDYCLLAYAYMLHPRKFLIKFFQNFINLGKYFGFGFFPPLSCYTENDLNEGSHPDRNTKK